MRLPSYSQVSPLPFVPPYLLTFTQCVLRLGSDWLPSFGTVDQSRGRTLPRTLAEVHSLSHRQASNPEKAGPRSLESATPSPASEFGHEFLPDSASALPRLPKLAGVAHGDLLRRALATASLRAY